MVINCCGRRYRDLSRQKMKLFFKLNILLTFAGNALTQSQTCGKASRKCDLYEFECGTGHCLNLRHYCDGVVDCLDGSDEVQILNGSGCSNPLNDAKRECQLPAKYECDSVHHCEGKLDEANCERTFKMKCNKFGICINKFFLNCSNREEWTCPDEVHCNGSFCSKYFPIDNGSSFYKDISQECGSVPIFSCDSGECLDPEKFCDGVKDCSDGSDEILAHSANTGDGVACSNKWNRINRMCVLPRRHVCDRIDHCDDRVDECQVGCKHSFICDNGKCLPEFHPSLYRCNARDDCGDSSDESSCAAVFTCGDGTAIAMDLFCNGRRDCPDGSDEIGTDKAEPNQTICKSRYHPSERRCVLPDHHVCDGAVHCRRSEDELDCPGSNANNIFYQCKNQNVVEAITEICDFKDNCCDSSDECDPIFECNKTFTCNNKKCIAFSRFCDGVDDCGDRSDEEKATSIDDFACNNEHNDKHLTCALPRRYVCDGLDHCSNRVDECDTGCSESFFCTSGQCISRSEFCDGRQNCPDNSDEKVSVPGFKCHVPNPLNGASRWCVISQEAVLDDEYHCRDNSDDCNKPGNCFRCITENVFVASRQVCDGIIDCPDLSDECLCTAPNDKIQALCNDYCLLNDSNACRHQNCGQNEIACGPCITTDKVCDESTHCANGVDEVACQSEQERLTRQELLEGEPCAIVSGSPKFGIQCDGIPQCAYAEDECSLTTDSEEFVCGNKTMDICRSFAIKLGTKKRYVLPICPGRSDYVLDNDICNGVEDCSKTTSEEVSVDERGCADRWRCSKSRPKEQGKITIHATRVCDGTIDCEEEEDEAEDLCSRRGKSRFYCESRKTDLNDTKPDPLFVSSQQVLDGKFECWDNSDECPTKLFQENTFSSRHRMIRNMILSCLVWIMGILALFGNIVVMWHSVSKLRSKRFSSMMKSNYVVVFNLAVADFLMGIYLLALAIQNATTNGSYCKSDRKWRSGSVCAGLGSLVMVSLQASVCFLVLLTTYRTLTVVNPFRADRLRVKYTAGFVAVIWIVSLLLAIIPLLGDTEDYFLSSALISPGVYFFETSTPSKKELAYFVKILMSYQDGAPVAGDLSWSQIRTAIEDKYHKSWPEMKILGQYGYYSAHSVCLPKLFVKAGDNAWGFSLFVMIFDFVSFLVIVTAYTIMYKDAARHDRMSGDKKAARENKTLQTRISRLVLADFLCLVPVCVTAFVSIAGVEINSVAYAVAAIVLLPINSALNPIIYSNVLGILYSSCVVPAHSCFTKMLRRRHRGPGDESQHSAQRERLFSNYNRYRTSTTSNEFERAENERMRLSSNGSAGTNRTSISLTTNSKL